MTYRSPVADILYSLTHVAGFDDAIGEGIFGEFDADTAASVIGEAGRFATDVIAPLVIALPRGRVKPSRWRR